MSARCGSDQLGSLAHQLHQVFGKNSTEPASSSAAVHQREDVTARRSRSVHPWTRTSRSTVRAAKKCSIWCWGLAMVQEVALASMEGANQLEASVPGLLADLPFSCFDERLAMLHPTASREPPARGVARIGEISTLEQQEARVRVEQQDPDGDPTSPTTPPLWRDGTGIPRQPHTARPRSSRHRRTSPQPSFRTASIWAYDWETPAPEVLRRKAMGR